MKPKKLLSFILVAAMTISLLPTFTLTASATTSTTEKNITLGTSALSGYDSTDGYDYIYYGTYNNSSIKWRILDTKTNMASDGLFLLSDVLLGTGDYGNVYFQYSYHYDNNNDKWHKGNNPSDGDHTNCQIMNAWKDSDAQKWCQNFYSNNLTTQEQGAVLATTKSDAAFTSSTYRVPFAASENILSGDKIFFLSAEEAENGNYGFTNDSARIANYGNSAGVWWLRSPLASLAYSACAVDGNGAVSDDGTDDDWAARPAFNLNLSSVLFTSAANGGKSSTAAVGGGAEISKNADYIISGDEKYEYKLTMKDDSRDDFKVTKKTASGTKGETITLDYENAETGSNEYISAMIVNNNDEVLYYGQLANITNSDDESGTVDFVIPSDIDYGTYKLKLFNEQINGDCKTDYSSGFSTVELTVEKPKATFTTEPKPNILTYNGKEQELVTAGETSEGTVKYSFEENGTYTTNIPTYKNATTDYTVWYYIEGDSTHSDSDKASVKVTISQKEITTDNATVDTFAEMTYNGQEQTPSATVTIDGLTATGEWSNVTNVSDETTFTANGNFTGEIINQSTGMKKLSVIIEWKNTEGLVFDNTKKTISAEVSNKKGNDVVNITIDGDLTGTNKGTYTASVTAVDNENYTIENGQNLEKEWVISQASDNVITGLAIDGWTYGDTANIPTATAKYGTPSFTYSEDENGGYAASVPTNAGTYWVKATVAGTDNYAEVSSEPISFKIAKADSSVTTAPKKAENLVYTGDELTLLTMDGTAEGGTIKYSDDGTNFDYDFANIPKVKNADDYRIWYKVIGDENHNDTAAVCIEIKVAEKQINTTITLTAPVKNATPQTSIETDEYTATVVWSPTVDTNGTFAKSTEYTATITVTPKANYTVSGIAENGYTLDGATSVTNDANSNVVTAIFPKTAGSSGGGSSVTRYTVKFNTDGGNTIASQTVTKNSKATEPTKPTKEGYIFDGWYTDSEFTTEYDFDTKVTKNITLYAKWSEDEIQEPSDDEKDDEPQTDEWKNPFGDVEENDWFFDNVRYANENGLMSGTTATTFAPNDSLTRAMLVTVLWRAEGEPNVDFAMPFTDVIDTAYYAEAVRWAASENIVNGITETEFAPDMNITREQIATIIYRYAKYKGYDVSVGEDTNILSYTDFDEISEYAIEAVQYAVGSGLIKGKTETTLNPKDNATRAEIAAILNRFIENNK